MGYDDHIWIVVGGKAWAIRRIRNNGRLFDLWRGIEPNIQYATLDAHRVDWNAYCYIASLMLAPPKDSPGQPGIPEEGEERVYY